MRSLGRGLRKALVGAGYALLLSLLSSVPAFAATIIRLSWDANTEPDLSGYRLKYGTAPGSYAQTIDVGNVTTYDVRDLPEGTIYYFAVHAYDTSGNESGPSNEVSATPKVLIGVILNVSASDAPDPVMAGADITYTITYGNAGDTAASGVVLTDTIPVNTSFVGATGGGTLGAGIVSWTIGALNAGSSGSVQLVVKTMSPLPGGTVISNGSYALDSNETTPVSGAAATTIVNSFPVLGLQGSDAPDPVSAGSNLTYTFTYTNGGSAPATSVVIADPLPADTLFVSATGGGAPVSGVVTWNVGPLAAGGSGTVQLVVQTSTSLLPGTTLANRGAQIDCAETGPAPAPDIVTGVAAAAPPAITSALETTGRSIYLMRGGRHTIEIQGTGFQAGAVIDLGADVSAGPTTLAGSTRLTADVILASGTVLGPRDLTLTNPDGARATRTAAFTVVKKADIDGDCRADGSDLNAIARAWNTTSVEAAYSAAADLDGDAYVGPLDLTIFAKFFGRSLQRCP